MNINETGFQKLALAVIKQAIKDALKGDEDSFKFLTQYNRDLEFWCFLAGLNPFLVYKETIKLKTDQPYWIRILKELESV